MTFNKMRFPIVWITFATLCVVLCSFEVHCGPVGGKQELSSAFDQKDQEPATDIGRSARQVYTDGESDESGESEEDGDDGGDDGEQRSLRRFVREVAEEKPVVEEKPLTEEKPVEETDEESVLPAVVVPEKKPSVLELLSNALDKAIAATQKIPAQNVATDAAGVFQILGQVFTEAIDKVIGDDDGAEETVAVTESSSDDKAPATVEEPAVPAVVNEEPMKVEEGVSQ